MDERRHSPHAPTGTRGRRAGTTASSERRAWTRWPVMALLLMGLVLPAGAQDAFHVAGDDVRVRGNRQAPLTLVEYSDFTCGFCEKFFMETWPRIFSEYVQTGMLRLVYRDFPRAPSGPSVDTAQAARCAGDQGRYWAMHDRLFAGHDKFSSAQLRQHAAALSLDTQRFAACLEAARDTKDIFADRMEANNLGFRGTPGFVLYLTERPDEEAVAIPGAFPYATFKEEIDKLLTMTDARARRSSAAPGNADERRPDAASVTAHHPARPPA